ncbi:hypothetical protein A8709_28975 [Paenibacillus pectinilyticus]|uniref:Uncharacterized protein n=1 Tax=Paenibacillus pectinilyticus TaxID=512399 RepID=A0A1C0ZUX6_9BACL|nr:hypothetical protein A8709_28975 [Paenibacillus pectinilyticus]
MLIFEMLTPATYEKATNLKALGVAVLMELRGVAESWFKWLTKRTRGSHLAVDSDAVLLRFAPSEQPNL